MASTTGLAWANFISTLGSQVPQMLQAYNQNSQLDEERARQDKIRMQTRGILQNMPQVGDMPAKMSPQEAMDTWLKSSPEDKMKATAVLGGQFVPAAQKAATLPPAGGSALTALASPPPAASGEDALGPLLDVIKQKESGGNYQAQHPKAANGLQAVGAYGIVPSVWFKEFPQYGLDANKPADVQRFVQTPALQDAMAKDVAKQLWEKSKGDPRRFRALYYSGSDSAIGTPDEWKPQFAYKRTPGRLVREKVQMPSIGEDSDAFVKALQASGANLGDMASSSSEGAPYDNSALMDLIKEKPKKEYVPQRVTYADQERYLLEKVKDPEVMARLKDYMGNISKLAEGERKNGEDQQKQFNAETERYDKNVVEASKQALEVWKTKYQAAHQKGTKGSAKDAALANLKELRGEMQQRIKDVNAWATNYLKADDEQKKTLASLYPEFMVKKYSKGFFGGETETSEVDPNKLEKETLRLRSMIDKIGAEIAPKAGIDYEASAGTTASPEDFFINK